MSDAAHAKAATAARLERLRAKLEDEKLDAILISSEHNRRYLSGFNGTAGYLLVSSNDAVIATDFRYVEQAAVQAPGFRIERVRARLDWLPRLAAEMRATSVGIEADDVTLALNDRMTEACNEAAKHGARIELASTSGITAGLRSVKDADELSLLMRAVEIGDESFDEVAESLEPGVTETEVAWRIERSMRERGAESLGFDTIVASGANGARPHHLAAERELREGEPVVIDMGCRYQGYCSDLTRTLFFGEPSDEFKNIYDVVFMAQLTAIETVEAGMTGVEADRLARVVIDEAGYGEMFGHSLGHGIGLEVHESPGVGPNATGELRDGMVFTVEPGIYLPGRGGVRIEDVVVLENGRARVISKADKVSP